MLNRRPAALILASALAAVAAGGLSPTSPAVADGASVVDLGPPPGMFGSRGVGIDARGVVAGTLLPSSTDVNAHVGVWADGAWRDFGTGTAQGMSSTGDLVGFAGSGAEQHAARWTSSGSLQELGRLPGGSWSQATAANTRGDVVGYARGATTQAVLWRGGIPNVLRTDTGESYAYGIDDAGDVVGSVAGHAVEWTSDGRVLDLGAGDSSVAYAINANGVVVGDTNGHPFAWSDVTGLQYLSSPANGDAGAAMAINASGAIVGDAQIERPNDLPVFHAVVWQNGQATDLNDLLPADSGWELGVAAAIADDGDIVGTGVHDGQMRAFLLHSGQP